MRFPLPIPEKRDFDVVGFGTNAVDHLVTVPRYPEYDSKIKLESYVQAAGGEIGTAMAALSRLGLKTSYIGRFGSDPEGSFGLESLREDGVDLRYAEVVEGARTQIAFIIIDGKSGERTVIWDRDRRLSYQPEEVPIGIASRTRVLHFTPHDTEACIVLAREAKESGAVTSIDIDNVFDGIDRLLPFVDILVMSADFGEKMLGIRDPKAALTEFGSRFGCSLAGMTLGENGSLMCCDGTFIESAGFAVPGGCKDTTGAGDSFRAGLLYGLLEGEDVEDAALAANAVAALKCREVGARTALPTREELESFVGGA